MNKYYIGSTLSIAKRLTEHNRGKEKFTLTGIPWVLVYTEYFAMLRDARSREREIKAKKSRKYIEGLIENYQE